MTWLVDTNVISEVRKQSRANPGVRAWLASVGEDDLYLSALVLGELRKGVESVRLRDGRAAVALERWVSTVIREYADRVLPVTPEIADVWGRLNVADPLPTVDSLMAATAHVHGLTLVTRNTRDIARTGVACLNPFS